MTDSTNVISLSGEPVTDHRVPNQNLIEVCAELLDLAKSGEIDGIHLVMHYADHATATRRAGFLSWSMIGRLQGLITLATHDLLER
jgi:hypothetical protein